ncbi:MAG: DUF1858 domain-containing protein [Candidatus Shapirobacteria bacterium]
MAEKISLNTKLITILEKYPKSSRFLMEKYNLHCFGCALASLETIGQGLGAHGLNKKEILKIVEKLNNLADTGEKKGKNKVNRRPKS